MDGFNAAHFTMAGMWEQMGFIARVVVAILLAMSVWSVGYALERWWRFRLARKQSLQVAAGVSPLLRAHKLEEAIGLAREARFKHSHLARVLAAGLTEFRYEKEAEYLPPDFDTIDSGRRAIEREAMMATAEMRRGLSGLATISTTAPFVGLFGTVVGIITAFRGMAISGSGGLGAVSAGIAEALAATALGLGVAIPAVWLYNHFSARIERFNVEMSNASAEMVDYFTKNRHSANP
jgi:biopolymer transport protein ExbB